MAALALLLATAGATRAQAPTVMVTPAGPLTLCAGSTQTLTATATVPGFNVAGSGFDGQVYALAVQADGKVLVGGAFTSYNGDANAPDNVLRLNADGSLDTGFNSGGTGTSSAASSNVQVYALAVQADGKVLVGGNFYAYNGNAAAPDNVLRLNADGSLDTGFNNGGAGPSSAVSSNVQVQALAVQADGKVLVGGAFTSYNGNANAPHFLVRLNADGSLDTGFNNGGAGPGGGVTALAVQADGKVMVGGLFNAYNGSFNSPTHLVRLNADGSLDTGFNNGGAGPNYVVYALAVQADGKVLIGGNFTSYNGNANAPDYVLRLNADGSLDTGFNNGGSGANSFVLTLAVQADGKVLVGGYLATYNGNANAPNYLISLNADGSLDTGFNNGATAGANNVVRALAVQADGKVLVGGQFTAYNGNANAPDYLIRLNTDGSLNDGTPAGLAYTWSNGATGPSITVSQPGDYQATATTTSNGTGYSNVVRLNAPAAVTVQVTPAGPLALTGGSSATLTATATVPGFNVPGSGLNAAVSRLAVQADGKVLVGGSFTAYNGNAAAPDYVLRLNTDGSLDTGFNNGGRGASGGVNALAVQADGKVLVGGGFTAYNGNTAAPDNLLRLNANGSLDTGFNNGATAGASGTVYAVAVQADGKVLVAGSFTAYNGNAAAPDNLLRLNADGSLDNTFNPGGSGVNNYVNALAVQADGKILVGGYFTAYNGSAAAPDGVLRLNADGSLDNTFNNGGSGANSQVNTVVVQADGKILAGGYATSYNGSAAAPDGVLRLNANGTLDTTFNPSGKGTTGAASALAIQADGKVVMVGYFTAYNGSTAAPHYLVRLNADGSLDNTFNTGGSGTDASVVTLVLQADGRALVGGNFTAYNGNAAAPDFLLRLNADGSLNNAATALPGATFVFTPGGTTGATRTVSTAGTYTATATDPATGCTYTSNAVVVTTPAPTLTTLSPTSGLAGSTLAATGTNLQGASAVTFTSNTGAATAVPAGYVVASDGTGLTGIGVPAGLAPGAYTVTVTTPNGVSNGLTYTVQVPAPTLTGVSPAAELPGTVVTLTGTGFTAGSTVSFGGTAATGVTVGSATSLTVTVPASLAAGSAPIVVSAAGSPSAALPFTALAVYSGGALAACTAAVPATASLGDGAWHYLLSSGGQVVAAYQYTGASLGDLAVDVLRADPAQPVRQDGNGRYYLDRNFHLTASAGRFDGRTVALRLYGLNTEQARLQLADPTATLANLKATQYSGPNEDCDLANDDPTAERRTLAAPASSPAGTTYFVAQLSVADHFSEFYLTGSPTPLPVELTTFTATAGASGTVRLAWTTASELNSHAFEMERSLDGVTFGKLGTLAAAGTSLTPRAYALLDAQLPAGATVLYYRLRQVDQDGTAYYSGVRTVALAGASAGLSLYPNPAHGGPATLLGAQPGTMVTVLDALGRSIVTAPADARGTATLVLPQGLAPGVYVVRAGQQALRLTVE
jgi:uncharacterized delta-60 repeat protein